jgi:hypothetical protein
MSRFFPYSQREFDYKTRQFVTAANHIILRRIKGAKSCFFVEKRSARWQVFKGKMTLDTDCLQGNIPDCDVFYVEKLPIVGFNKYYSASNIRRTFNRFRGPRGINKRKSENLYRRLGGCSNVVFLGHSISLLDIYNTTFVQRCKYSVPTQVAATKNLAIRTAYALNSKTLY